MNRRFRPDAWGLDAAVSAARMSIKIEIRNHKKEAVEVNVIEHMQGDWDVTAKSQEFVKMDSHTIEFPVKVAADGTAVTYTARYRY